MFIDIDECSAPSSRCQQTCVNHDGFFSCQCEQGYRLESDGFSCTGTQLTLLKKNSYGFGVCVLLSLQNVSLQEESVNIPVMNMADASAMITAN